MSATPRVICCDTCPMSPTCEERNHFLADIGLAPQWGEEYDDELRKVRLRPVNEAEDSW